MRDCRYVFFEHARQTVDFLQRVGLMPCVFSESAEFSHQIHLSRFIPEMADRFPASFGRDDALLTPMLAACLNRPPVLPPCRLATDQANVVLHGVVLGASPWGDGL